MFFTNASDTQFDCGLATGVRQATRMGPRRCPVLLALYADSHRSIGAR